MRWTERQQHMLGAMGIALWQPGAADAAVPRVEDKHADASAAGDRGTQTRNAAAQTAPTAAKTLPPAAVHAASPAATASIVRAAAGPGAAVQSTPELDARAAEIATLEWPALRAHVAACRACGLCEGRTQTVFGVGHVQAHCMIVGEAPGENEDRLGEPFVGAAGQLLDRMLQAIGLTRAEDEAARQVYIANTLKCRPPRNRNPEPDELARCSAYLQRQIELVQPRLLLAMGRFAVQTLLGSNEAIGKLRGRVHRATGRPVVVTYHPAYLLRNPADKARAWADLCLAAEQLGAVTPGSAEKA